jgi:hypothetical protein
LRVDAPNLAQTAALLNVSDDGREVTFDSETGFLDFPGGHTKFTIRFDPVSGLYWSLANPTDGGAVRNVLAASTSRDLRTWTVRTILLRHPDRGHHAFQYPDWLFDAEDLIALSRTAFDDDEGGAHNFHDANYLTFHRVPRFRERTVEDAPLG